MLINSDIKTHFRLNIQNNVHYVQVVLQNNFHNKFYISKTQAKFNSKYVNRFELHYEINVFLIYNFFY